MFYDLWIVVWSNCIGWNWDSKEIWIYVDIVVEFGGFIFVFCFMLRVILDGFVVWVICGIMKFVWFLLWGLRLVLWDLSFVFCFVWVGEFVGRFGLEVLVCEIFDSIELIEGILLMVVIDDICEWVLDLDVVKDVRLLWLFEYLWFL